MNKIISLKKNKKIIIVATFLFVFLLSFNSIFATSFIYDIKSKENSNTKTDESSISTVSTPEFTFQSEAQLLMEPTTGKILYANNEDERLLPASVTKIMTMLLIDEALKAIAVVSANDTCVMMAEHIGGSESNFVKMMNDKAQELKMENTHFMNCHGIDEDNHYSTAKDIAIMSAELINKHPDILKYTSIWMDSLRDGAFGLSSTNKLIRFYDGATGLKTGSTSKALFNLSGTATRNNTTFIAVVLRAPSSDVRLAEVKQLLDYRICNL